MKGNVKRKKERERRCEKEGREGECRNEEKG
jgi:hypothetical protein